jgi:hypothetical protein
LAELRWFRAATTGGTIIRTPSRCGWPAAESNRASRSGETDDLGFNVTGDRVHVHDLHATLLHLLGFDHEKLTYRFQGRDFRLTDVMGLVVDKLASLDARIRGWSKASPQTDTDTIAATAASHRPSPRQPQPVP